MGKLMQAAVIVSLEFPKYYQKISVKVSFEHCIEFTTSKIKWKLKSTYACYMQNLFAWEPEGNCRKYSKKQTPNMGIL